MITVASGAIAGLENALARFPVAAKQAAVLAVNDTVDWSKTQIKAGIKQQVNLPEDSITPARFGIRQRATSGRLEAVLSASNAPLGLIRFVTSARVRGAKNIRVRIKPRGKEQVLDKAFLIPTPGAPGAFALAIRAPGGLSKSRAARRIPGTDIYILSGPSPNQLLGNLAPALVPQIETRLSREWQRQFARLVRG
jgi:hypothetical protein